MNTTVFVSPNFTPTLTVPTTATSLETLYLQDRHAESAQRYVEYKSVEKVLLRHVQTAVEETYLEELIDNDTELTDDKIPDILEYLFTN